MKEPELRELREIAQGFAELIAKLQFLAAKLEKAIKEGGKN